MPPALRWQGADRKVHSVPPALPFSEKVERTEFSFPLPRRLPTFESKQPHDLVPVPRAVSVGDDGSPTNTGVQDGGGSGSSRSAAAETSVPGSQTAQSSEADALRMKVCCVILSNSQQLSTSFRLPRKRKKRHLPARSSGENVKLKGLGRGSPLFSVVRSPEFPEKRA